MYALSTSTVPSSAYERDWGDGMDAGGREKPWGRTMEAYGCAFEGAYEYR
jgi:hypothetical protein